MTKDAVWNILGQATPLAAAFFTIPPLLRILGSDRFGVLALAWMIIGYFSFFDLGIGRALTQLVSGKADGSTSRPQVLVSTALLALTGLGLIGGALLALLAPWFADGLLDVPPALREETVSAFRLMGAAVPLVTVTSGLRGLLEAQRRFKQLNLARVPLGVLMFVAPWATAVAMPRLAPVLLVLWLVRAGSTFVHAWLVQRSFTELRWSLALDWSALRELVRVGGWMTVSNIVSPLMVNLDRFVIGGMLSLSAVSYYATPYEIVTKLLVVGGALSGSLFPALSAAHGVQGVANARALSSRSSKLLLVTLSPVILVIVVGAHWGLSVWISADFAEHSAGVLRILALGVLINTLASIPFVVVQGLGRPDLTARLHLLELPGYLCLLWVLIRLLGIEGAAWAWSIRVAVDFVALKLLSNRLFAHRLAVAPATRGDPPPSAEPAST